jgi:UTP--glucose-1-phosphate uridylyltransferase
MPDSVAPPVTHALIPAAGKGVRMLPATRVQAKELLPLGCTPVIQLVAEELLQAGIKSAVVVTASGKGLIAEHFTTTPELSALHAEFVVQPEPRGVGDAVRQGEPILRGHHFVVAMGDSAIQGESEPTLLQRMISAHRERGAAATIAVQRVTLEQTRKYGMLDLGAEEGGTLPAWGIVEKPGPEKTPSLWAVTARYVLSPMIFDFLAQTGPGVGGEVQLTDALQAMIEAGLRVQAVPLGEKELRLDVGNMKSYGRAFLRTVFEDSEAGPELRQYASDLLEFLAGRRDQDPDHAPH